LIFPLVPPVLRTSDEIMLIRAFLVLAILGGAVHRVAAADVLEHVDLPRLLDPATRKEEVVKMLARQDAASGHHFKRSNFRLVTCPQGAGLEPLHMLMVDFGKMLFEGSRLPGAYEVDRIDELFPLEDLGIVDMSSPDGPGLERLDQYVITVFDPAGQEIRPFKGNTMINSGYLADFDHDGITDRLDCMNYGVDKALDVQVMELWSVEREPRQLLNVLYNWHPRTADEANAWDYECFDDDKDGLIEIGFGPKSQERRREVVFRWNKASSTFLAENLDQQPHVRVLANSDPWKQVVEIHAAGGLHYPLIAEGPDRPRIPEKVLSVPRPYQFQSLEGRSDEDIAREMGGKPVADAFHPADAPDTHLPEGFWKMDPKSAALALVEANRTPAHRKMVRIAMDDRGEVKPPADGWLAYDFKSSSCYVSTLGLTVLRFGNDKPYLFQAASSSNGFVGGNPIADRAGHGFRLISLSADEARFLSQTLFWLDRIRSRSASEDRFGGGTHSTADGSATLDWSGGNHKPRRVQGTVWHGPSKAARWSDNYDQSTCINFCGYLLTVALPEHLAGRWDQTPELDHRSLITPLVERLKPRADSNARDELASVVLTMLARHRTDPLPSPVLSVLVNCAGDSGLSVTLPALEELNGKIHPSGGSELEFRELEIRFKNQYGPPDDPEGKKQWQRYQSLRVSMAYDIGCQLREPLPRAIAQLSALYQPARLIKMADGNDASATWALQQLQLHQPEAYADTLIDSFRDADPRSHGMIFSTLAAAYPPGARLLRDTLTAQQKVDLAIQLAAFERQTEPELAVSRIPELLEIARDAAGLRDYNERGPAIELLTDLPLDEMQRVQFEAILLAELKSPQRRPFKISILPWVTTALIKLPDPDRHWDALVEASDRATESGEFYQFLDALSALAKPETRMSQLVDFIRPCFTSHGGRMNDLFAVALALDLRELAPEIAHLASTGPDVEDGRCANGWGGDFTGPGNNRYHLARNVTALWAETDADTLAKMWLALVISHPGEFSRTSIIARRLREGFRAALGAASPDVREKLTAQTRTLQYQSPYLLDEAK